MNYNIELYAILSSYFCGNKARIICMANILIGLTKAMSVNLFKVATNMPGNIKIQSKYRKLQRFFSQVSIDFSQLANFIINQISNATLHTIILDRTNWEFGKKHINILMLSIAWYGISIPLLWINLNRPGNSKTMDRIKIVQRLIDLIGIRKILCLVADREFIGGDWFKWLNQSSIKFVIRLKISFKMIKEKKIKKIANSFRTLPREYSRYIHCTLWGVPVTLVGYKNKNGDLFVLATNGDPDEAIKLYNKRWQIESIFACLKTKGFNLEDTGMTDKHKLNLLVGLLAILTCWNCKLGFWAKEIKDIRIKKHHRPEQNLFHYGISIINAVFNNINDYYNDFKNIMKIIGKPTLFDMEIGKIQLQCV